MTVKKTPNSFCETLINNYSFFFRSNQRASVIIILYICYESLRKVLPAATYSLNLSRSSLRDYSPDEGKKMDILILGFYALSLHLPVAKYRKGLFCRDLRSNNCCRTEACDYCTTREGRGVKCFLSLFLVMYICLNSNCISYILPAGKSISPLKGLKPASLKILSPIFPEDNSFQWSVPSNE